MFKRFTKEALIGVTTIFDGQNDPRHERIEAGLAHVFIDIVSLDGVGGAPVTPGAGTYEITFQDTEGGGFKTITDNGSLDATRTGGSVAADGVQLGASFSGNPLKIKIIPTGVTVAAAYKVQIKQNLT